jgi:hypothetical protein
MTLAAFKEIVELLKKQQLRTDMSMTLKIDLIEFADPLYQAIDVLIEQIYGKEGHGWFTWFCYDNDFGSRDWSQARGFIMDHFGNLTSPKKHEGDKFGARDEKGEPICFSVESTWEFLEENYAKKPRPRSKKKTTDINKVLTIINGKDKNWR